LKEVARQFETLFLDMILKSMRSATASDSVFDSEATQMFTGLLDHEYSRKLADKGGLGLADLLVRQLSQIKGELQNSAAVKKSEVLPIKTLQTLRM
jgi:flagellar protein FlgJ